LSSVNAKNRWALRLLPGLLGVALLTYLILHAGPADISKEVEKVGRGLGLTILLGGLSHLAKTWAWRLTFSSEIRKVPFVRTFALRLASEAAGTFGLPGKVLGDTVRVSLLGSTVPIADCISSVTLDRGLYAVTSAIVSIAGILCALAFVSFSAAWRAYALLFASALAMFLVVAAMAIRKSWPVFSGPARVIAKLPWFKHSLRGKQRVIESSEKSCLGFITSGMGRSEPVCS